MNSDFLPELRLQLDELMPVITERLKEGHHVRFLPRGISMLPMLREGIDSVVLSPAPAKLRKFDLPLYRRYDGKYILHRVVKAGDTYTCIGDNQFVFENGVGHEQVIALVTAFYRKDKKYSVNQWNYRVYCFIWHYTRPLRHFWRRVKGWLKRHLGGRK